MKILFRPYNQNDEPLILSSWLRGGYHLCPAFSDMPKSLYYGMHEPAVKMTLATSDCLCAVDVEDPTHVLSYVVYKHYDNFTVLHWIYTKQQFRGFKLATMLLKEIKPQPLIFTSHETQESQRFLHKRKVLHHHVPHFRHGEWHSSQVQHFIQLRSQE